MQRTTIVQSLLNYRINEFRVRVLGRSAYRLCHPFEIATELSMASGYTYMRNVFNIHISNEKKMYVNESNKRKSNHEYTYMQKAIELYLLIRGLKKTIKKKSENDIGRIDLIDCHDSVQRRIRCAAVKS